MAVRETTTLTVGKAGSGKTLTRCAYYIPDQFLRFETGKLYTNFPVNVEAMAAWCESHGGPSADEVRERIVLIPRDELKKWSAEVEIGKDEHGHKKFYGPWSYFEEIDLQGAHIAIDEAHNYLGRKNKPEIRKAWQEFCGELRHNGATIEFLTQNRKKLADEVELEAGQMINIASSETEVDTIFGISMADWYELRAGFITGEYKTYVIEQVHQPSRGGVRRWEKTKSRWFVQDPERFKLYDSYNVAEKASDKRRETLKATAPEHHFQRLGKFALLRWFLIKNWEPIFIRICILVGLYAVTFGGLPAYVMKYAIGAATAMHSANAPPGVVGSDGKPVKGPTPVSDDKSVPGKRSKSLFDRAGQGESVPVNPADSPEVIQLREGLRRRELEAENLREYLRRQSDVVGMVDGSIILRDGRQYSVGDVMEDGVWNGEKLTSVDPVKRLCVVGGRVFRMAGKIESRRAAEALAKMVPGDAGGPVTPVPKREIGKESQSDGSRSAAWGSRPADRPTGGYLGGDSGKSGRQIGNDERKGSTDRRSAGAGGSSRGSAVDSGGGGFLPGGSSPGGPGGIRPESPQAE